MGACIHEHAPAKLHLSARAPTSAYRVGAKGRVSARSTCARAECRESAWRSRARAEQRPTRGEGSRPARGGALR